MSDTRYAREELLKFCSSPAVRETLNQHLNNSTEDKTDEEVKLKMNNINDSDTCRLNARQNSSVASETRNVADSSASVTFQGGFQNFRSKPVQRLTTENTQSTNNAEFVSDLEETVEAAPIFNKWNKNDFCHREKSLTLNERFGLLQRGYCVYPIQKNDTHYEQVSVKLIYLDRRSCGPSTDRVEPIVRTNY